MATSRIPASRLEALRKEVFDCSRCGFCRVWNWKGVDWVCPTYPYTEAFDTQYARGRVNMAQQLLEGEVDIDETFLEHLAQCSLCGSCGEHCPVGMPLLRDLDRPACGPGGCRHHDGEPGRGGRQHRAASQHLRPRAARPITGGGHARTRSTCCTSRAARPCARSRASASRPTELLDKLGVNYAVLEEDACCGYPLFDIGQMDAMRQAAEYTLANASRPTSRTSC